MPPPDPDSSPPAGAHKQLSQTFFKTVDNLNRDSGVMLPIVRQGHNASKTSAAKPLDVMHTVENLDKSNIQSVMRYNHTTAKKAKQYTF